MNNVALLTITNFAGHGLGSTGGLMAMHTPAGRDGVGEGRAD